MFLPEALAGRLFPCLFRLLEALCLPWPTVFFLHIQSQHCWAFPCLCVSVISPLLGSSTQGPWGFHTGSRAFTNLFTAVSSGTDNSEWRLCVNVTSPSCFSKCLLLESTSIHDAWLSTPGRAVSEPYFSRCAPLHPEQHAPKTTKPGGLAVSSIIQITLPNPLAGDRSKYFRMLFPVFSSSRSNGCW